jgi:hypothetical protein
MSDLRVTTVRNVLRQAAAKSLEACWLYLPHSAPLTLDSECAIVVAPDSGAGVAAAAGFPVQGLDTQSLEDAADCALQFELDPSDELLLESFVYYWRFDAWLPSPGAPDPLPPEQAKALQDREFFNLLKPRPHFVACKKPGCKRGAVEHSVLCNVHHFEMIKNEPCPFGTDA